MNDTKIQFRLTLIFFLLSIGLNILCLLPYIGEYYEFACENICPKNYYKLEDNDSEVIKSVVESSMLMNGDTFNENYLKGDIIRDILNFFRPKRINRTNNFHLAYLYAGLSYYAEKYNDEEVLEYLESTQSLFAHKGTLNYEITEIDQVPIGLLYINLYKMTGNRDYYNICMSIYDYIDSRTTDNSNIISYREKSNNHLVDAIGMFVPFLIEYAKLLDPDSSAYKNTKAYQIAYDNVEEFYKFGCDKDTGIPMHGYNKETHVKVGSANWGRGIGWYLLGLSYMPEINQDLLDSNIKYLNYSQFPLSNIIYDSSTSIMFELYKKSRNINFTESIDFIKPHITKSGHIDNCSGDTYGLNAYSSDFGPSELTNGLFLILISTI